MCRGSPDSLIPYYECIMNGSKRMANQSGGKAGEARLIGARTLPICFRLDVDWLDRLQRQQDCGESVSIAQSGSLLKDTFCSVCVIKFAHRCI